MDFSQPHRVLLFFEKGQEWLSAMRAESLSAQWEYYLGLKAQSKVYEMGFPEHGEGLLIGVSVNSDTELDDLLQCDPALKGNIFELVQAIPYL